MATTTTYTEVAAAAGAWTRRVLLPQASFDAVRGTLKTLTRLTGTPITAFLLGEAGDPVSELVLARDPSRSHGTPDIANYEALAARMTEVTGWRIAAANASTRGVLVGLGLREGYLPTARQHTTAEAEQHLARHGSGWTCQPARLVSARLVTDPVDVRWYDEVGVLLQTSAEMTPVIEQLAGRFRQHRFVVTDHTAHVTRALATA